MWVLYAILGTFGIGLYNHLLERSRKHIPYGFINKHIYLSSILFISGIISGLFLGYYNLNHNKEFNIIFTNHIKWYMVLIPALVLNGYMMANIVALSNGGGIAMGIFSLSMYITLFGGVIFLGDKINKEIIISMLIAIPIISYAVMQSIKINKK